VLRESEVVVDVLIAVHWAKSVSFAVTVMA
jgi:hypothetical protein